MIHPYLEAVILGVVQGVTEFLPISSSGHLVIIPHLTGWPYFGKPFDVALHLGTLGALLAYFWRDLAGIVAAKNDRRFLPLLIVSTVPAGLAGLFLEHAIDEQFGAFRMVLAMLFVFGLLLGVADRLSRGERPLRELGITDALLLGLAQALALIPGVSRSGVTITAARFLGFDRETAARYSFWMAVPIVGGAGAYEVMKLARHGPGEAGLGVFCLGMVASCVVGYLCIGFFLRYVTKGGMMPFVAYRVIAAIGLFALTGGN